MAKLHPRVEYPDDLVSSVRTFQQATPEHQRWAISSKPIYFLHLRDADGDWFAPSKFSAFIGLTVADYHRKKIKQHYTGGENKAWIARVVSRAWKPLSEASAATQRAFSQWFTTLMGREVPSTYAVYLMELRDGGSTGKPHGGSSSGGDKRKAATGSSTQSMTPEQLARRIAQQAATGKAGEAIAWRDEIDRLRQLGIKNPEQCVEQTATTNVAAGYDLESTTSTERRLIEVKSSTDGFSQGFFLSRNEWKTLEEAGDGGKKAPMNAQKAAEMVGEWIENSQIGEYSGYAYVYTRKCREYVNAKGNLAFPGVILVLSRCKTGTRATNES
jgi:hypothetical protein